MVQQRLNMLPPTPKDKFSKSCAKLASSAIRAEAEMQLLMIKLWINGSRDIRHFFILICTNAQRPMKGIGAIVLAQLVKAGGMAVREGRIFRICGGGTRK
jgi:hypothetical protein